MHCSRIFRSIIMWNRVASTGSAVFKRSAAPSSSFLVGATSSSSLHRAQRHKNFSTVMKPAEKEEVINVVITELLIVRMFLYIYAVIFRQRLIHCVCIFRL